MKPFALIVDGKSVEAVRHREVRNPATGDVVGLMPLATVADLDLAVLAAKKAFESWKNVPGPERADACRRIAAAIERNSEELAKLLTLEQGKPLGGLGSRFEIGGAVAWTRHTAEIELPVEVLQDSPEGRVELHRKPIGVVGSITPWNWPVMIACWHIIPAVRAGNTVIVKPSPNTPLSTIRLVEIINEVSATGRRQRDHLRKRSCGGDVAPPWNRQDDLHGIHRYRPEESWRVPHPRSSGSPWSWAATMLASCFLTPIRRHRRRPVLGLVHQSGQTCACLKRLYVHDSIYNDVCRELTAYASCGPCR